MANKLETYQKVRIDILENPRAVCLTANEYIIRYLGKHYPNCQYIKQLGNVPAVEGITRARRRVREELENAGILKIDGDRAMIVMQEEQEYREFYRPLAARD